MRGIFKRRCIDSAEAVGKEVLCKGKAEGTPADNDYIEWPTGLRPGKSIANVVCLKYRE